MSSEAAPKSPGPGEQFEEGALLKKAEQVAGLGAWEFDVRTRRLIWSSNLFRLFGYEPGEVEPTPEFVIERVHPDDRELVGNYVASLSGEDAAGILEYRVLLPSGEVRHFRSTMVATETQGEELRVVGSIQDVTEWRRSEREVAAHNALGDVLREWKGLATSGRRLLARLADPLGAVAGSLWVPTDGVLVATEAWSSKTFDGVSYETATLGLKLPRGVGLSGLAYERSQPVTIGGGVTIERTRSAMVSEIDLRGGVAYPAIDGGVNMVIELLAREQIELTESLGLTLRSIGHTFGEFMARRRGELEPHSLTSREIQVLQCAAKGFTGPAIAEQLSISAATVKSHFENIYAKLEVPDRSAAVAAALRLGLIE